MNRNALGVLLEAALDLVFPPRCEVCQELGRPAFCDECMKGLQPMTAPLCGRCGAMLPPAAAAQSLCAGCRERTPRFDGARSVGMHVGPLRRAILNYKFNNRRRLAAPLGELLAERLLHDGECPQPLPLADLHAILPIPLHPSRRAWRGFDQCQQLCRRLGAAAGLPVIEGELIRTRRTLPQVDLTPNQRWENVRGAFAVRGNELRERNVLLVDDVFTTGATAERAAQACREAGAATVLVLTLSRPTPPWHPAAFALEPGEGDGCRAGN